MIERLRRLLARLSESEPVEPVAPDLPDPAAASLDRSGYVREAAVRALAEIRDGSELPHLLLRTSDWVPQVRRIAITAVRDRITPAYAPAFAANLALLARLQAGKRADAETFDRIARVTAHAARAELIAAMASPSRAIRDTAFRLLLAGGAGDDESVFLASSRSPDIRTRLHAVRRAAELLPPERLRPFLAPLLSDAMASIRREALQAWAAAFPDDVSGLLTVALLDRSESVRSAARFVRSDLDPPGFYRQVLAEERRPVRLAAAAAGLGAVGLPSDVERLVPLLSHGSARVRRAAIGSIAALDTSRAVPLLLPMLCDSAAGVSARARSVLSRFASELDSAQLMSLFHSATPLHAKKNLLLLIAALPKWEAIIGLLTAAAPEEEEEIASLASELVHRWNARFNRSQLRPSESQLATVRTLLAVAAPRLRASDAKEIGFAVRAV